jgi:hypothetical protein
MTLTIDIFHHHVQVAIRPDPTKFIYHNGSFTIMATIPIDEFTGITNPDEISVVAIQLLKEFLKQEVDTTEIIDWRKGLYEGEKK